MEYGYLDIFVDTDQLEGLEEASFIKLDYHEYEIKKELRGYTFLIKYKITSGKWNGWFIAEVYQGLPHPFLIIPPEDIVDGEK